MGAEIRQFRRRHVVERHVLQIVRGKSFRTMLKSRDTGQHDRENSIVEDHDIVCFWCLREFARRCGLEIMAEDCHYVSISELWLLRWLAEAQRHSGLRSAHIDHPGFRAALVKSAEVLRFAGLFLPPRALNIAVDPRDVSLAPATLLSSGNGPPAVTGVSFHVDHGS